MHTQRNKYPARFLDTDNIATHQFHNLYFKTLEAQNRHPLFSDEARFA